MCRSNSRLMELGAEGCSSNSFATGITGATRDDVSSPREDAAFASDANGMNPGSSGK